MLKKLRRKRPVLSFAAAVIFAVTSFSPPPTKAQSYCPFGTVCDNIIEIISIRCSQYARCTYDEQMKCEFWSYACRTEGGGTSSVTTGGCISFCSGGGTES